MSKQLAPLLIVLLVVGVNAEELVDRVVAVVDKDPIFLSDIDGSLTEELYIRRVRGEPVPTDSMGIEALRQQILKSLIDRRIVIVKARKEGLQVTKTEVEDALDEWLADLIKAAGTESAFTSELEKQGLTLSDFKARYRKDIEEQLLVSRFMRTEFADIEVSEEEVRHFFESKYDSLPQFPAVVGMSHIIIIPGVSSEREAEILNRVEKIMDRIRGGEPFEDIAREMSEDELTREVGGRIGTVGLKDLRDDIAWQVLQLEPGEVSDPIRTTFGFEILRLDSTSGDLYTLKHIFVRLHPEASDTLRAAQLAHDVRMRAISGESFEALARQYSDDEKTRADGGYIGEVDLSTLDQIYREAISQLSPGDISEVMRTQYGFQIFKLVSSKASRTPSFEEVREWIRNLIEARKREERFEEWLMRTKEEVYVKELEF